MNENYYETDTDIDLHTATDAVNFEIDYEEIENAFYNALVEYNENNIESIPTIDTDTVEFASGTDARLFTVKVAAEPTSSAQQATAYLADIRNCVFLFLSIYFILTVYSKLKNMVKNFYSTRD